MTTIGSLCSGYEGIGLALPGDVAFVCDPEPAAALLLKTHHPDAPNHHDLKALAWAKTPVDLLTAGYPCQPFSGAGQRKGTDDPRHLWPYIAEGIALSRPPLVLLENVRGHLSLGWDTVLIDLHRLGYDVRWTLIRAADVGAPHGRARLYAVAANRDTQRWEPSSRMPVARAENGELVHPEDGLFGSHPLPLADNGHVPMWAGGLMVDGIVWEQEALLGTAQYELLPTPRTGSNRASRGALIGTGPGCDNGGTGHWSAPGLEQALELAQGVLPREYETWDEVRGASGALLPTPSARLGDGTGRGSSHPDRRKELCAKRGGELDEIAEHILVQHLLPTPMSWDARGPSAWLDRDGDGLPDAVALLPTPEASDASGGRITAERGGFRESGAKRSITLASALHHEQNLLPTPTHEDYKASGGGYNGQTNVTLTNVTLTDATVRQPDRWGRYAAAIARCEALTRPAPDPTLPTGKGGAQRLSPAFVEWMMMLPEGWVTGHGLKRDAQLKLLGNGVVPAQARAAWQHLTTGLTARQAVA